MPQTFSGIVSVTDAQNNTTLTLNGNLGDVTAGGGGQNGFLVVVDSNSQARSDLNPGSLTLKDAGGAVGARLSGPTAWLKLGAVEPTITLLGAQGRAVVGGGGTAGELELVDEDGNLRVRAQAYTGTLYLYDAEGVTRARLGGPDQERDEWALRMSAADGTRIVELGPHGNLTLGGGAEENPVADGDIVIRNKSGRNTIHLSGDGSRILLQDADGNNTVLLDGEEGDIVLMNADTAEEFETDDSDVEAGSIMTLTERGTVRRSRRAYDPCVAGVVSGAGGFRPGVVLGHRPGTGARVPIAVLGQVECRADASERPIRTGDLLTTSDTPGHAMRVGDPARAPGAVIGKAIGSLPEGRGLLRMLVSLG